MSSFNFLHISDFHVGLNGTSDLWPQIREQFQIDIRRHTSQNGPLDLVIFSGDLTQAGTDAEFSLAVDEFRKLWSFLGTIDQNPKLFIVPGNHDLSRPKFDSSLLMAIENVRKRSHILPALLSDESSEYRKELKAAFSGYTKFLTGLDANGITLAADNFGAFPGDCSVVLRKGEFQLGIIGLNTTWSQLEKGNFLEKLEITPAQVKYAVNGDVTEWTALNEYNLLVTHHPKNWLGEDARIDFDNEINPFGRFDGHFCGHMHELLTESVGMGGKIRSRVFQAASLFGLEKEGDGTTTRRHGYNFFQLDLAQQTLKNWPRKASKIALGGWRINVDDAAIEETGEISNTDSFPIRDGFISKKKI
ncbi:metallophosphoesterase family protein [Pseudomonas typographi]|uniref:metallophosphoesterase family protein n=1 Tax=Pseudomonas typographi TaxID=2715964 RepID=UPI0016878C9D|nr:metallophosphoesterase [Pseudomonas typographi]MBD1553146.1 hypothetical protein [Pseudomonas typographi]MBD1585866.1 hypothetical protein [Pseudomonas typographi]